MNRKNFLAFIVWVFITCLFFSPGQVGADQGTALAMSISRDGINAEEIMGENPTVWGEANQVISVTFTIDPKKFSYDPGTLEGYGVEAQIQSASGLTPVARLISPTALVPLLDVNSLSFPTDPQVMPLMVTAKQPNYLDKKSFQVNFLIPDPYTQASLKFHYTAKWTNGQITEETKTITFRPKAFAYLHAVEEKDWLHNKTKAKDLVDYTLLEGPDRVPMFENTHDPKFFPPARDYAKYLPQYQYLANDTKTSLDSLGEIRFDKDHVQHFYYVYRQISADLLIKKTDKETKMPMDGASYTITNSKGEVVRQTEPTVKGEVLVEGLPLDTYTVQEILPQTDYAAEKPVQKIVLDKDRGVFSLEFLNTKVKGNVQVIHRLVDAENHYLLTISTDKLIDHKPLGTPYEAKTLDPALHPDYRFLQIDTENSAPPMGFVTAGTQTVIFLYKLAPASMDVIALNPNYPDTLIPNISFDIYSADNKPMGKGVTEEILPTMIEGLPRGKYLLQNIVVPNNYQLLSKTPIPVNLSYSIDPDLSGKRHESIRILVDPKTSGIIRTTCSLSSDPSVKVPDVTFDLYNKFDQLIVQVKTRADSPVELSKLPLEKYTIKNIKVPEGYVLASNPALNLDLSKAENQILDLQFYVNKVTKTTVSQTSAAQAAELTQPSSESTTPTNIQDPSQSTTPPAPGAKVNAKSVGTVLGILAGIILLAAIIGHFFRKRKPHDKK